MIMPNNLTDRDMTSAEIMTCMKNGYYVDEGSGKCCSTENAPLGCHFKLQDNGGYKTVAIIADCDGEVLQEPVFWPSLEAMSDAGIDVSMLSQVRQEGIKRMVTTEQERNLAIHIQKLLSVGSGEIDHLWQGSCPDQVEGPNVRDFECPACKIMIDAEIAASAILG